MNTLTDSELAAFCLWLEQQDMRLTEEQQPFARNMVQQIKTRLAGEFNPAPGAFERAFNYQLVRFVQAGGPLH